MGLYSRRNVAAFVRNVHLVKCICALVFRQLRDSVSFYFQCPAVFESNFASVKNFARLHVMRIAINFILILWLNCIVVLLV